jgi:phosphoribosyl-AMP cyclohydrolase
VGNWLDEIKFDGNGLVPAIIEDAKTREVLMMAWMNREAVGKTLSTRQAHFYSRSRGKLWLKGESSGHVQKVKRITLDCDGDTLLVSVDQKGGACHAGYRSCFYRKLSPAKQWKTIGKKIFDPEKVYKSSLRGTK